MLATNPSADIDSLLESIESGLAALTDPETPDTQPVPDHAYPQDAKVMIVDDEPLTIEILREHLQQAGYGRVVFTDRSINALAMMMREQPDVLLLDIRMPHIDGLEILQEMRNDATLRDISVIVMTATTGSDAKVLALETGATDFLEKPIHSRELLARLKNTLLARAYQKHLQTYSHTLEEAVRQRTAELERSRQEVIRCLARAAEFRDDHTGRHVLRVGRYARIIGDALGLPTSTLDLLEQAAQLHDVGKIGIDDSVLLKPGKLTPDEYELMQKHCNYGKKIISCMSQDEVHLLRLHTELGAQILENVCSPVLELAARIALTHHERWDGSGYPLGLAGEDIPLEGRITAVADVFDALSSKRPYKEPFPLEKCFRIMQEGSGSQFDPRVLDAFFLRRDEIVWTQIEYAESE